MQVTCKSNFFTRLFQFDDERSVTGRPGVYEQNLTEELFVNLLISCQQSTETRLAE